MLRQDIVKMDKQKPTITFKFVFNEQMKLKFLEERHLFKIAIDSKERKLNKVTKNKRLKGKFPISRGSSSFSRFSLSLNRKTVNQLLTILPN